MKSPISLSEGEGGTNGNHSGKLIYLESQTKPERFSPQAPRRARSHEEKNEPFKSRICLLFVLCPLSYIFIFEFQLEMWDYTALRKSHIEGRHVCPEDIRLSSVEAHCRSPDHRSVPMVSW
jgi:hypothetical protein